MRKLLMCLSIVLAGSHISFAQLPCGTDIKHGQMMTSSPSYKAFYNKSEAEWAKLKHLSATSKLVITGTDTVFQVPIVVHIIHSGEPVGNTFNPSDGAIDSLIDYLNKVWLDTWPAFPDTNNGGTRFPIQFVLAKRSPSCGSSNGIIRVNGSVLTNYASYGVNLDNTTPAPSDSAVKSLSIWPGGDFYNIWIVKYIDGPSGATAAAYAFYPQPYIFDGTVIAAAYVYRLPQLGNTYYTAIPHELGHGFGLKHTFEGDTTGSTCPPNADCTTEGDDVCDTEPNMRGTGVCASGINPCTGVAYAGVQHNIMNYTACPDRFTPGQRQRALFFLRTVRMGLVSSLGSTPPDSSFVAPVTSCIPGIIYPANMIDAGIYSVTLADITPSSYGYNSDGNRSYIDRTCIQQTAHMVPGGSYPVTVSTGYTAENVRIWIDYNNDGTFQASELAFSHNGSTNYEVHSGTVTVPSTGVVLNHNLRMRIMSDVTIAPDPSPCSDVQYGQTEDYSVNIQNNLAVNNIHKESEVSVFPNPAQNIVAVQAAVPVDISVYSIEGKLLLRQPKATQADISALAPGIYVLKVTDAHDGRVMKTTDLVKAAR